MRQAVDKIVMTFEQIDSSQRLATRAGTKGRLGAAAVWFCFNLIGLVIGIYGGLLGFAPAGSISVAACVAASQCCFAFAVLPAVIFDRYAWFAAGLSVFKWQEFVLWSAIAAVFIAAGAIAESASGPLVAIATACGLGGFVPAIFIARSVKMLARKSANTLGDFRGDYFTLGPLAFVPVFILLCPLVIVLSSKLLSPAATQTLLSFYPPTLVYRLVASGLVVPNIMQISSAAFWLAAFPFALITITKLQRKKVK